MMQKKGTLIVITGPTASGKTDVAIELATHFHTEIISSDSRQIYKELQVGTAVPAFEQLNKIKHHFIQNQSIHDYYNAYMFEVEVLGLLEKLFQKHPVVIMAGGSGMYIDAVCNGIDDLPTIDSQLRKDLMEKYQNEGIEYLRKQLKILDPVYYSNADLKNHKRMLKAIEVCLMTGRPYSSLLTGQKKERPFNIIKVGLNTDREILYDRINKRVDEMMNNGLLDEARSLVSCRHLNSLNTVGYKELFEHFENKISLEEAVELIKRNTRRYAKRQLTWFQRDKEIKWFEPFQIDEILSYVDSIASDI